MQINGASLGPKDMHQNFCPRPLVFFCKNFLIKISICKIISAPERAGVVAEDLRMFLKKNKLFQSSERKNLDYN